MIDSGNVQKYKESNEVPQFHIYNRKVFYSNKIKCWETRKIKTNNNYFSYNYNQLFHFPNGLLLPSVSDFSLDSLHVTKPSTISPVG